MSGGYGIKDLLEDLDRIVATERDPRMLIGRTAENLRKLMLNRGSIPGEFLRATNPSGTTRNLIHKHPEERYVVLAILWNPGYLSPIHDHGAWGVSAVYENVLRTTNFVRRDDGRRPDTAELNEHSSFMGGVASVNWVLPPNEEIHQIENPSDLRTVSVHIYGRDIRTCNAFDAKTGRVSRLDLAYHNIV